MVGLRYVFSSTSDIILVKSFIKPYLKNNHEIIYLSHSNPIYFPKKNISVYLYFFTFYKQLPGSKICKNDTFSNVFLIL